MTENTQNSFSIPPELGIDTDLAWRVGELTRAWDDGGIYQVTIHHENVIRKLLTQPPADDVTNLIHEVEVEPDLEKKKKKFQEALEKHYDHVNTPYAKESTYQRPPECSEVARVMTDVEFSADARLGKSITGLLTPPR